MVEPAKIFSRISSPERLRRMVETIFACKWSLTILHLIQNDINRPGAMVRSVEGLTPKVMNHCLGKLLEFSIIEKEVFPQVPPRVEYKVTEFGLRFQKIFAVLDELEEELEPSKQEKHHD